MKKPICTLTALILAVLLAAALCACTQTNGSTETTSAPAETPSGAAGTSSPPTDLPSSPDLSQSDSGGTPSSPDPQPVAGSEGLTISESGGECAVMGMGECEETDIVIPSHYNGKPVTLIDECAFQENTEIKSVLIPGTVQKIEEDAFAGCTGLESVTFFEGLEYLKDSAFYGCRSLKTVTLPSTLLIVGSNAFNHCSGLESVTLLGCTTVMNNAFAHCDALKTVSFTSGANEPYTISNNAFDCPALEHLQFAPGLKEIGSWNFADTKNLKSLFLPKSLTEIRACSFLRSGVEKVYYEGSEEEWKNVSIKEPLFTPEVVYNSKGEA